jgi:hypothetical protein
MHAALCLDLWDTRSIAFRRLLNVVLDERLHGVELDIACLAPEPSNQFGCHEMFLTSASKKGYAISTS